MIDNQTESTRRRLWAFYGQKSGKNDDQEAGAPGLSIASVIGGMVSLVLIVGVVYWVYQLGRRDANEVPVIQALGGVARERPVDPGGQQIPHQGLDVNAVLAGNETAGIGPETTLAPPPQRVTPEDQPAQEQSAAPPAAPSDPVEVVLADDDPADDPAAPSESSFDLPDDRPEGDPTMIRPVRRVVQRELSDNSDRLSDAIAQALALEAAGADQPVATPPDSAAPPASQPTGRLTGPVPLGTLMIQLEALDDEASVERLWLDLVEKHRDLLGDLQHRIERREAGGRVFYRLQALGFANKEQSAAVCSALLMRDVQCIPVTAR